MVFVTRYLDLVTNFVSVYNTVMKVDPAHMISLFYALFCVFESILKVFFIVSAAATVYLMYVKFRATYDGNHDSFRVEFLLAPVAILAMVLNNDGSPNPVPDPYAGRKRPKGGRKEENFPPTLLPNLPQFPSLPPSLMQMQLQHLQSQFGKAPLWSRFPTLAQLLSPPAFSLKAKDSSVPTRTSCTLARREEAL